MADRFDNLRAPAAAYFEIKLTPMKKILLILITILSYSGIYAQNDSIYFWKNGQLLAQRSIKTVDLDSITFKRPPVNPNGINIAGPNVTDTDGNVYQSVTNCGLTFTKQNLNVSRYSDGTPIPQVQNQSQWANLTTGAWCYYNNDPANGAVYGKLYNWYAVAGIYDAASAANPALRKKLAPTGWHVPTDGEWSSLINCLDPNADGGITFPNTAGGKMKSIGTIQAGTGLWQSPNTAATNESGFTGLPAGFRYSNGGFTSIGSFGVWWSSSEYNTANAWYRYLNYDDGGAGRNFYNKTYGFSLRCLRD
jgi:uncharacterized protein (TIGR02145 family)